MNIDLDYLDNFDACMGTSLGELFMLLVHHMHLQSTLKDKNYKFNVGSEIMEIVEASKFYGKDEEYPYEHLTNLNELACLFGKNKI
jgi:hypothetical protein